MKKTSLPFFSLVLVILLSISCAPEHKQHKQGGEFIAILNTISRPFILRHPVYPEQPLVVRVTTEFPAEEGDKPTTKEYLVYPVSKFSPEFFPVLEEYAGRAGFLRTASQYRVLPKVVNRKVKIKYNDSYSNFLMRSTIMEISDIEFLE